MASANTACPLCASPARLFFKWDPVPVHEGSLLATPEEALAAPTGRLEHCFCDTCGHVFNRAFDLSKIPFNTGYDISLFHSNMYADSCRQTARQLVADHHLQGKTALEIACGKGEFLQMLVDAGMARGVGFDPSFVALAREDARITVHRALYDPVAAAAPADLIVVRSALQYFQNPYPLLKTIRHGLAHASAVVFVEVPDALDIVRDLTVWNLVYEHGCFYSSASLRLAFARAQFDVVQVRNVFGAQTQGIEASRAASSLGDAGATQPVIDQMRRYVDAFPKAFDERLSHWRGRLAQMTETGRKVVLWGAGARAISFCTFFKVPFTQMPYVVDINPNRQGKFLPLTGQQVVSPEFLKTYKPDVVIATNSTFAPEIERQLRALGLTCGFEVL